MPTNRVETSNSCRYRECRVLSDYLKKKSISSIFNSWSDHKSASPSWKDKLRTFYNFPTGNTFHAQIQTNTESIPLTSTLCASKAWNILFLSTRELKLLGTQKNQQVALGDVFFHYHENTYCSLFCGWMWTNLLLKRVQTNALFPAVSVMFTIQL